MVFKKKTIDKDVLTLARERIALMYDRYDHVVVMFSGGKDSTVVFQLCYEEAQRRGQTCHVVFWDEEAIHPETIQYVARVAMMPGVQLRWIAWPVKHRNACSKDSPWWWPWAPEAKELWVRPHPFDEFHDQAKVKLDIDQVFPAEWVDPEKRLPIPECNRILFPPFMGSVGVAMGIRAQESMRRYRSVAQRIEENWIAEDQLAKTKAHGRAPRHGIFLCKPIYDWRTEDVWTAPQKFGWDTNKAYDLFAKAGFTMVQQRVCPPFGEEPLQGLWCYSVCFPELWEKMIMRVPGAATAARYGKSPLYGGGARADAPPEGMTWQAFIREELANHPPDQRAQIAQRIQKEIETHNRKTGNAPIPDKITPGILSWQFLHQVARRGDLKKRKDKIGAPDPNFDKEAYAQKVKDGRKRVARGRAAARKRS